MTDLERTSPILHDGKFYAITVIKVLSKESIHNHLLIRSTAKYILPDQSSVEYSVEKNIIAKDDFVTTKL